MFGKYTSAVIGVFHEFGLLMSTKMSCIEDKNEDFSPCVVAERSAS